jgi:hypothetical protein
MPIRPVGSIEARRSAGGTRGGHVAAGFGACFAAAYAGYVEVFDDDGLLT